MRWPARQLEFFLTIIGEVTALVALAFDPKNMDAVEMTAAEPVSLFQRHSAAVFWSDDSINDDDGRSRFRTHVSKTWECPDVFIIHFIVFIIL
jgi:hypothetical protein